MHSVVPYDVENNDNWNGPSKYDYCRPVTDPDFGCYQPLMSVACSDCDVNNLTYHTYKHAKKIFNNSIMAISTHLNRVFDITRPCVICEKTGHSFDDCEELKDQAAIWKSYIQLCMAL